MTDLVIIAVVAVILAAAAGYVWKSKKQGGKCIGCPAGGCCSAENGKCTCGQTGKSDSCGCK